jgi:N-acetylmuramoyl-L-alanine amidase
VTARLISKIILHCSATPNGRPHSAADIDRWHADRGFARSQLYLARFNPEFRAIGYHFVIRLSGEVELGRHLDEVGAHARPWNTTSLGICMIGTDQFTAPQWAALRRLVSDMTTRYPSAAVIGHRDVPGVNKICPGFSVKDWLARGMSAPAQHLLEAMA